jgi:hypothetical protein
MVEVERAALHTTLYEEPVIPLEHLLPEHLRPTRTELELFRTREEWLAMPSCEMGSEHSVDHPARVLIWQDYITRYMILRGYEISEDSQNALRWFATIHDSQRLDDDYDIEHGERAAQFALDNLADYMTPAVLDELVYLCRAHVPHDDAQPPLTITAQIAKDADMLDRGRCSNDLDRKYVRLMITHALIHHARELHSLSLQLDTGDQFMNVIEAAIRLGYVRDE